MASIEKRGETYRIRVSCGYDTSGRQIMKRTTWKPEANMTDKQIERELQRFTAEFESKVMKGDYADTTNIKLSDFCAQYLEIADTKLAPTTKELYRKIIDKIIKPSLGHMKLKDIKPIHVQRFIQMLGGDGVRVDKKGDKLCPATVKRYFTVLKSIMAQAYKLELISQNPTNTLKLTLPEVIEPDIEIFTKAETEQMLSCLEDEPLMFQVFVHLAVVTGCRRGELTALKWSNIDFDSRRISIKQSNYKLKGEDTRSKMPKTKSSIRNITVSPYVIDLLKRHQTKQTEEKDLLGDTWVEGDWVFTKWNGEAIHPTTPTRQFTKFLEKNNIPHRKLHALRHTSATYLLTNGTDIKTVANRLGHAQLKTTNRYIHALLEADEAAAQAFESLHNAQNIKPKDDKNERA